MSIKTTLHATAPLLYLCRTYRKCRWGLYASPPPLATAVVGWFSYFRTFFFLWKTGLVFFIRDLHQKKSARLKTKKILTKKNVTHTIKKVPRLTPIQERLTVISTIELRFRRNGRAPPLVSASTHHPKYFYTPLPLNLANKQASNNKQASKQALLLSVLAVAPTHRSGLYSTLAILEPRWCPCQIQTLSQKLALLESGFKPHSPRYMRFLVLPQCDKWCAQFGPFLAFFGFSFGHIAEFEGSKGLFVTRNSRRRWTVRTLFSFFSRFD